MATDSHANPGAVNVELQAQVGPSGRSHIRSGPAVPAGVTTGRSGMADFAAKLAAQHIIDDQDNEPDYPITVCNINVPLLCELFSRMIWLLIRAASREMGYPNLTAQAYIDLRLMAHCVGWNCAAACYLVTYNKGIRHLPSTFLQQNIPPINYLSFPIHITALINSIGPIVQTGFPARRTYVPYIDHGHLVLAMPTGYNDILVARFFEKFPKTKYLTGHVEPLGTSSSAWWSLWPSPGQASSFLDDFTDNTTARWSSMSLFSPVPYSEILNELKCAMVFISEPLTIPGMAHHSCSIWYETDELSRFTGELPPVSAFPASSKTFPFYDKSYKAVITRVETALFDINDVEMSDTVTVTSPQAAAPRGTKRRRFTLRDGSSSYRPRSPTVSGPSSEQDNVTRMYRVVYFYFDHKAMDNVTPQSYTGWSHSLNAIN